MYEVEDHTAVLEESFSSDGTALSEDLPGASDLERDLAEGTLRTGYYAGILAGYVAATAHTPYNPLWPVSIAAAIDSSYSLHTKNYARLAGSVALELGAVGALAASGNFIGAAECLGEYAVVLGACYARPYFEEHLKEPLARVYHKAGEAIERYAPPVAKAGHAIADGYRSLKERLFRKKEDESEDAEIPTDTATDTLALDLVPSLPEDDMDRGPEEHHWYSELAKGAGATLFSALTFYALFSLGHASPTVIGSSIASSISRARHQPVETAVGSGAALAESLARLPADPAAGAVNLVEYGGIMLSGYLREKLKL
ncbi:MAG: hypothetical protein QF415_13275 [Candidatus Undinarchaeales archaeon]|nr:hypothetical protein [Candidatus Undinarchaeales archaeon]MDP7494244.1 hypothetical protein [Candidatus Undinarchaeales archaeon]